MSDLTFLQLVQRHLAERGKPGSMAKQLMAAPSAFTAASLYTTKASDRVVKMHLDRAIKEIA